jgi:hypothetical protein
MANLYFFTLLPLLVGAILWIKYKEIVLWEWLGGTGVALIVVALMHLIIYHSMVADEVTLSGQIVKATFEPEWTKEYWITVCHTTGSGKHSHTSCHQERRTTHYSDSWDTNTNINNGRDISQGFYNEIVENFGGVKVKTDGNRYGLIDGDPNIYVTYNRTGYIYPVTTHKGWDNPVKASKSLFNYSKPSEAISKQLFKYPANKNWLRSDRLLGSARNDFTLLEVDRINAILGPTKKVNLIIVGFGPNTSEELGEYQKSLWGGGKENDLVITYGGTPTARWAHVFGWTEREIVKSNLETLFLTNKIDDNLLPAIKTEVAQNYKLKDWSKFNYLSIEPPGWAYWLVLLIVIGTQAPYWIFAFGNDSEKED